MLNNFLIKFSKKVDFKLEVFINFMGDTCRYKDSGLYNENLIVNNFIEDIKLLVREIRTGIENTIKKGVFGEIQSKTKEYEGTKLVIFIRSYNITCYCKKWPNNIITIEDIFIRT